jgi:tetratricopeptide (TPR) repeat protein
MASKKRQSGKGKSKRPAQTIPKLPDPRLLEARLRDVLGQGGGDTREEQAQDILNSAYEASNPRKRQELAQKALAVWPDCADAYLVLAEQSRSEREALTYFEQAVAAGERALGPHAFRDHVGHFWGLLETRPYMRARFALADVLWAIGRRDEAIGHLQEMLQLNPNDNQGVRYTLAGWLATLGRDDELQALLDRFAEDGMAAWAYAGALVAFRRTGDSPEARALLAKAKKTNKHVTGYLCGDEPLPRDQPEHYSPGDENEAVLYAASAIGAWKTTPGALAWLREGAVAKKRGKNSGAAGPLPLAIERLRRLPQRDDVWQAEVRAFGDWVVERGQKIRPWVAIVISPTSGLVMAHSIVRDTPSAETLWDLLATAMQKPLEGQSFRPTVLEVRQDERWQQLQPPLEELGIRVEFVEHPEAVDMALKDLFESVSGDHEQGLLDTPGITPKLVRGFYEAAADYYRAAPWRSVGSDATVKIECDQFDGGPWYAVIMGQSGMTFGLSLYQDRDLLMRTMRGELSEEETTRETQAVTVTFDDASYLPMADVEAVEQLGLPVAGPQAYPQPFRKEKGMNLCPPEPWELQLLEASLRAVPDYVARHSADRPSRTAVAVPTGAGEVRMTLSWQVVAD